MAEIKAKKDKKAKSAAEAAAFNTYILEIAKSSPGSSI